MDERVNIRVLSFDESGKEKVLYRNTVFLHPAEDFEFSTTRRVLKRLYPNATMIVFSCS